MSLAHAVRSRRVLALALGTMVVTSATAAWLLWQLAVQDRELQRQRLRERLESTADLVASDLRDRLAGMEESLDAAASPGELPGWLGHDGLVARFDAAGLHVEPPGRLVYLPFSASGPSLPPETFARGERLEFRARDYAAAIDTYERQSRDRDPLIRAGALLRLARVQRRAGRVAAAFDSYRELAGLGATSVEGLPAELLARHALCRLLADQERTSELAGEAARLREGLLGGAWRIDRGTFLHYAAETTAFLEAAQGHDLAAPPQSDPDEPDQWEAKLFLASAVDALWALAGPSRTRPAGTRLPDEASRGRAVRGIEGRTVLLSWWPTADGLTALVAGPETLRRALADPVRPLLERRGTAFSISDAEGRPWLRAGARPEVVPANAAPPALREISAPGGQVWKLQVESADPAADLEGLASRDRRLLAASGLVLLVLLTAIGFSARAVARELAVSRLQSQLVTSVSHDFRTPLTSLKQATEALVGGRVPAERQEAYYRIQMRAVDRLQGLVEGLLDAGRIEAGARTFDAKPLDARSWIERVVAAYQTEVAGRGYRLESAWSGPEAVVSGDEPALSRAVWNLLDNAVKYSPDCKTIWLDAAVEGRADGQAAPSALFVRVRDRGIGIAPAERSRIFERFERGAAARGGTAPGTGLGLTIVEHIVRAHGGEVEVEGAVGEGSVFTIRLPLGEAA